MKFSLAVLVFTLALFAQQSEQQFFGRRFGGFGGLGFGGGLGFRRFGFGMGGLGLGLGLGGIPIPVPVAVPVPVGAGLGGVGFGGVGLGGFGGVGLAGFGKRSVNETESVEGKLFVENGTVCTLSTHRGIFSCAGLNFNFECGVVSNLTVLGSFEHRGENFRMLPEGLVSFNSSESLEVNRVEIVSFRDESVEFNDYTFVHGGQKVLLSLYWSESVRDLGFRFVEQQCWRSYVDMLRSLSPRNVRLVLDIARV